MELRTEKLRGNEVIFLRTASTNPHKSPVSAGCRKDTLRAMAFEVLDVLVGEVEILHRLGLSGWAQMRMDEQ